MNARRWRDGLIEPDSRIGRRLHFTSSRYFSYSYLTKVEGDIYVSAISCAREGRGDLRRLFERIEAVGLRVAVPLPLAKMQQILERWGFVPTLEANDHGEGVDVWRLPAGLMMPRRRRTEAAARAFDDARADETIDRVREDALSAHNEKYEKEG